MSTDQRPAPTARRRLPAWTVVLGVVAVAGGALVVAQDAVVPRPPLSEADVSGPGAALPGGLRVVEGSRLLGQPAATSRGGQQAVLVVEGDLQQVLTAYVEQAERVTGTEIGGVCRQTEVRGGPYAECSASGYRQSAGDTSVSLALQRWQPDGGDVVATSGLVLTVGRALSDVDVPGEVVVAGLEQLTTPLPDRWAPGPEQGEAFGAGFVEGEPGLDLVEGSRLVGPPVGFGGSGGFAAVLRVDGDPQEVLEGYVRQVEDQEFAPQDPDPAFDTTARTWGAAGGGTYVLSLSEGDPRYLLVLRNND